MVKKKLWSMLGFVIIASMILAACAQPTPETVIQEVIKTVVVTEVVEGEIREVVVTEIVEIAVVVTPEPEVKEEPITLNINLGTEPPTADPSLATDNVSINVIRNTFVGLTQFDPSSGEVIPYLATSWEAGEDADGNQTWTFHLRDDIAWVRYDPVTSETTQEVDEEGNPRFVNAYDVEYGVKRTLDPATGSNYSYVLYSIVNAFQVNSGEEGYTLDDVGVIALDDTTVQFTLEQPAGFFPAISGMWVAHPMPQWAIEEWGIKWIEAGLIVTNGPYVMEEWIHGGEMILVKNPLWVDAAGVQIERVHGLMIEEASTEFALYENNELDTAAVPLPEMDRVKADPVLGAEYHNAATFYTYYYGFTNNKPPMDDARVRRAFSMAIDRQSLIDNVLKGGQLPATSFAPPGIFGAPELGSVGLGYDPDGAKASLQEYLDDPDTLAGTIEEFNDLGILLMHNTSEGHARIAAAIQQMWKDVLGVEISIENMEWKVYTAFLEKDKPLEEMPHVWRMAWGADYPDENNWVHEVFNSLEGSNRLRRNCADPNCSDIGTSEFDELTALAGQTQDPAERAAMYEEAERILSEEEAAVAFIYHGTSNQVTKPWLTRNFPALGGQDWFNWIIDWDAKQAGQGN